MAYEAERRVILGHQQALATVRARVRGYVIARYRDLGSWRDADIERFISAVVPLVESGQKQTGQLTIAYLDAIARLNGLGPTAATPATGEAIRGVPMAEVYRRPAEQTWYALSQGKDITEAVALGATRLDMLVEMDMQLAQTWAARDYLGHAAGVVGYQRVLGGGEHCLLCIIASTQRYHKADLMPIHDRCNCSVAPIYGDRDPGQTINLDRYAEYQQVMADKGLRYSDIKHRKAAVRQHGEHGPTLTWADQQFNSTQAAAESAVRKELIAAGEHFISAADLHPFFE